jgi:hypothetical protein
MGIKIIAGWSRKDGRQPFGSEGVCINFEVTVDTPLDQPAELMKHAKTLTQLAKRACDEEINKASAAAAEAAELAREEAAQRDQDRRDQETEDRRNGHRPEPEPQRQGPPSRREGYWDNERGDVRYGSDGDFRVDDERRAREADRDQEPYSRGHNRDQERRENGGQRSRLEGQPPRNAKQFAGWVGSQQKAGNQDLVDRVKGLMKSNGMVNDRGSIVRFIDLRDDDAVWLYQEATRKEQRSQTNGYANSGAAY